MLAIVHENDVIGKDILYKFAGAPLAADDFGWYHGKIQRALKAAEKQDPSNEDCGFYAIFDHKADPANERLRAAWNSRSKLVLAVGTDVASRGERWVLLRRVMG